MASAIVSKLASMEGAKRRAKGCLLGLFAGDAFGAQYEFLNKQQVEKLMSKHGCKMDIKSPLGGAPGQITDDSCLAIELLNSIIANKGYSVECARKGYKHWYDTYRFGCGEAVGSAIGHGKIKHNSKANGAMMRVAPIGIYYGLQAVKHNDLEYLSLVSKVAYKDCNITHSNPVCGISNEAYATAIALSITTGGCCEESSHAIKCFLMEELTLTNASVSRLSSASEALVAALKGEDHSVTEEENEFIGYVGVALQNAVYQLNNAKNMKDVIMSSTLLGGDTDTNSCIAGAICGASMGYETIPQEWIDTMINCKTSHGKISDYYQSHISNVDNLVDMLVSC